MKSRDALLVLIVIGIAGALSFVAYQYGRDQAAPEDAMTRSADGGRAGMLTASSSEKDADADKPPVIAPNEGEPPMASAALEEAPLVEEPTPETAPAVVDEFGSAAADAPEAADIATATPLGGADVSAPVAPLPPTADAPPAADLAVAGAAPSTPSAPLQDIAPERPELPGLEAEAPTARAEVEPGADAPPSADAAAVSTDPLTSPPAVGDAPLPAAPTASLEAASPPPIASDPALDSSREAAAAPSISLGSAPTGQGAGVIADAPPPPETRPDASPPIADGPPESAPAAAESAAAPPPAAEAALADVNDPASFPEEPGRGFVSLETSPAEDVTPPEIARPALGAPMVDGAEDVDAASRDTERDVAAETPVDPVAVAVREGDDFVETPISPVPPDPAESPEDDIRPIFDIVRVERDGSGVLAGRAEPGALVTILVDGNPSEVVQADARGDFVVLLLPPEEPPLSIRFDLEAQGLDGAVSTSEAPVIVTLPADPAREPMVVQPTEDGVQLLGPVADSGDDGRVVIQTVTYGETGDVTIAGSGAPGEVARVYLDDGLEAEARVSPDGDWRVRIARDVPPAVYTLRVDQMTTGGIVTSRAETPFERAATDLVLRQDTVIVQPGNNLWMIADYVYGEGARYTIIYDSNRDQIRDPNLIYPGQILSLPEGAPPIASNPG